MYKKLEKRCDAEVLEQMANYLLTKARCELVEGDSSYEKSVQNTKKAYIEAQLPHVVGSTEVSVDHVCQRACYRLLNIESKEQLNEKMHTYLDDLDFWDDISDSDKSEELRSTIGEAYYEGKEDAYCARRLAPAIQDLQDKLLADTPQKLAKDAKVMIHKLDELESSLLDSCRVIVGLKEARTVWLSQYYWDLFSIRRGDTTVPDDVYKPSTSLQVPSESPNSGKAFILNKLLSWVEGEKKLILQVATDPGAMLCSQHLTWNEAIEFKRYGYDLDPTLTVCSRLKDHALTESSGIARGKGRFHKTIELCYAQGSEKTIRIFKAMSSKDRTGWYEIIGKKHFIDLLSPKFSVRNRAMHMIACRLNLGKRVPAGEFTVHNRQFGLLMTKASGVTGDDVRKAKKAGFKQYFADYGKNKTFCAGTMQQLNQLEWLDALCVNPDRNNGGNIMFDGYPQVTGIDNDICLYPVRDIIGPSQAKNIKNANYRSGCAVGYPLLVDAGVLKNLKALDIKALRYDLRHMLTADELDALEVRFLKLLEHAEGLAKEGFSVENWAEWKHPESGCHVYQYYQDVKIKRFSSEEEELKLRDSLAYSHEQVADEILRDADPTKGLSAELKQKRQAHLNLATTMRLGIQTSYTCIFFG